MLYLFFMLVPLFAWSAEDCSTFSPAIRNCLPSSCATSVKGFPEPIMTMSIERASDNNCQLIMGSPMSGKVKCVLKNELLPLMAEKNDLDFSLQQVMLNAKGDLTGMQTKISEISAKTNDLYKKVLQLNGGVDPCKALDPDQLAKFSEGMAKMAEIAPSVEILGIKKEDYRKISPDLRSGCILNPSLNIAAEDFSKARLLKEAESAEDCMEYKSMTCTQLLQSSGIKEKMICPIEMSLLFVDTSKEVIGYELKILSKSLCEETGIVKKDKVTTYDSEFKKNSARFCKQNQKYYCRFSLRKPGENSLLNKEVIFNKREGIEGQCLNEVKKAARPVCQKGEIVEASVDLRVQDVKILPHRFISEVYKDYCKRFRLKKHFN